jgi:hypothetical protein
MSNIYICCTFSMIKHYLNFFQSVLSPRLLLIISEVFRLRFGIIEVLLFQLCTHVCKHCPHQTSQMDLSIFQSGQFCTGYTDFYIIYGNVWYCTGYAEFYSVYVDICYCMGFANVLQFIFDIIYTIRNFKHTVYGEKIHFLSFYLFFN